MRRPADLALLLAALVAAPLAAQRGETWATVRGTVGYRERMALPPEALLLVRVEELPDDGSAPLLIAEGRWVTDGRQVPLAFQLAYPEGRGRMPRRYAIRAMIVDGERALFRSRGPAPLSPRLPPQTVDLLLVAANDEPSAALIGTTWYVTAINGDRVQGQGGGRDAQVELRSDGRVTGNGGCNTLAGRYVMEGAALRFSDLTTTLMACPGAAMQQELALLNALRRTSGYRMDGESLELLVGQTPVVRLRAGAPR